VTRAAAPSRFGPSCAGMSALARLQRAGLARALAAAASGAARF
jgi:hypothetical protein